MDALKSNLNAILLDPQYADYLALIKAARNGAVYGAKVRFPHALVMVFLFRSGTLRSKLQLIYRATRTHARNLATFAVLYKSTLLLLRQTAPHSKEEAWHTFVAGLTGGYFVFGKGIQSSVNQQIVIYVFARVVLACAKLAVSEGRGVVRKASRNTGETSEQMDMIRRTLKENAWPVFAAGSWAAVMWLFRWYPETLQPSLRSSMQYIYKDSDHWDGARTFLVHNK